MIRVDTTKIPERSKGAGPVETKVIPAGPNVGILVEYIEMGWHKPIFNGKHEVYSSGKRTGQLKDPEFVVMFTIEFPYAEHTAEFPLTWKASIPIEGGEFINKVSVTEAILTNALGRSFAERNKYVKWLAAFKSMTKNQNMLSISQAVGKGGIFTVTHREGKAGEDGVKPVYANLSPTTVLPPEQVDFATRQVTQIQLPAPAGHYAGVFDWDNPDPNVWAKLPGFVQERIKASIGFADSPVGAMLAAIPEAEGENHAADSGKPPVPQEAMKKPEEKLAESTNMTPEV